MSFFFRWFMAICIAIWLAYLLGQVSTFILDRGDEARLERLLEEHEKNREEWLYYLTPELLEEWIHDITSNPIRFVPRYLTINDGAIPSRDDKANFAYHYCLLLKDEFDFTKQFAYRINYSCERMILTFLYENGSLWMDVVSSTHDYGICQLHNAVPTHRAFIGSRDFMDMKKQVMYCVDYWVEAAIAWRMPFFAHWRYYEDPYRHTLYLIKEDRVYRPTRP